MVPGKLSLLHQRLPLRLEIGFTQWFHLHHLNTVTYRINTRFTSLMVKSTMSSGWHHLAVTWELTAGIQT